MQSTVYLIGAGPGASDLITVRGARILESADIVFYDALIDHEMLFWCKRSKLVPVGKRCGAHSSSQHFINKAIVDAARKYSVVVRLKGGDPLVFGRAAEEISALENAGINYEVVPGITAALAASAQLKQPPTVRGLSRTFTLTTIAGTTNYDDHPTRIYYMGRNQLTEITEQLLKDGYPLDTPVCLMESVTLPAEKRFVSTLGEISRESSSNYYESDKPTIILVGEVYRNLLLDKPSDQFEEVNIKSKIA